MEQTTAVVQAPQKNSTSSAAALDFPESLGVGVRINRKRSDSL
jgi:hypothetical protein